MNPDRQTIAVLSPLLTLAVVALFVRGPCYNPEEVPPVRDAGVTPIRARADAGVQPTRLRIVNGCGQPLWIFWQLGYMGGQMPVPHQTLLSGPGDHVDYPIPDQGLAGTRFWAGYGCDSTGNNCRIGQSGGPANQGFTCPPWGCAPPIDSKFEGTFGCMPYVPEGACLLNPSSPTHDPLPRTDGRDTSAVDGFTLPYRVRVIGHCGRGPTNGVIDCSALSMASCPTFENLSSNGQYPALSSVDMRLLTPTDAGHRPAGCYSDCARLTFSQWSGMGYTPNSPQALSYCCPTPPVTPAACSSGPVAQTGYTRLIHQQCPQVYGYAYDDGTGNWTCDAGTKYEVTFYCPR